jgi:serine/threonine-protein kinase
MHWLGTTMATAMTASSVALPRPASDPASIARRRGAPDDGLTRSARVGSWCVTGELGRGGMSSVHAVVHAKFGKRAAIKIAHRSVLGPGGMSPKTFLREARIVHTVEHPAVIDVFATGTYDGRPYLVMEKLVGTPLGRRVDEGPLPRRDAIAILLELCDVLRAAHAAGVVHRDLKLDNVFLCDTPFADGRRVKLLDWGVAHVAGEDDPFRGLIAGTLTYVAPEQIRGDELTGAADIYSLAVLAYHLLCRRPPFAGADLALLQMHLRAEPPPPRLAWPDVPGILDDLLVRMLAKQPDQRPSLDEVEHALRTALDEIDAPPRFAAGSQAYIALPANGPWYLRWLLARAHAAELPADVLGRPVLPVPPFKVGWICVALAIVLIAAVVRLLP